ncbi:MAG: hypothetical protein NZZ41_07545 [Candidatus Dojkabacteria bacterium]|nr:hypothetical protein [Candidatus Dojkabacteria bacterium]
MAKKIRASRHDEYDYSQFTFVFDEEHYQKNRARIHFCINELNKY